MVALLFALPCYRKWVSILAHLVMLLWFCDGRVRSKVRTILADPLWRTLLLFIALNLLSLLWSAHPGDGWSYLLKYRYLLLAPMLATSLEPRFVRPAFTAFGLGTGVALGLLFAARLGLLPTTEASSFNPAVTMSHLDLSMFLAVATLLAVHRLLSDVGHRGWWLVATLACGLGLLVNIGRSGQVAFFAGLAVVVFQHLPGRRWWRAAAALAVAVAILVVAVSVPFFRHRLQAAVSEVSAAVRDGDFASNQGKRIAGLIVAADIVREHPLLGTGVGDNMVEVRRLLDGPRQRFRAAIYWYPHLHNQYAQVVTELGILGLAALLAIFVQMVRRPFPSRDADAVAAVLAVTYLVGFLGDPYFHKQLPVALFAAILGLLSIAPDPAAPGRITGPE